MAKPIKQNILKSPYFFFSILALFLFVGVTWYVWRDIEKQSLRRANVMIKDMAVSNINIAKNVVKDYTKEIVHIEHILAVENNADLLEETFKYIRQQDSTIKVISITEKAKNFNNSCELFICEKDSSQLIRFLLPVKGKKELILSMDISTQGLHNKIAQSKDLLHAYVTIVADNKYVFHPNETMLGREVQEQELQTYNKIYRAFSQYLNLDVYRYNERTKIAGREWIFTANILKLDFQEYIEKREKAFMWILLAAFLSFLFIVIFGLLRWRNEFVKRKNVEQRNLALALKNEQQKQAAVSTELEILKSGLNPHFLFNAMSSLKILVNKKPELAKDFAVALSNVYRYMLRHEKENVVSLAEELRFVDDYMQLQKIRFGDKIRLEVILPQNLLEKKVPPISVQLLVENAIKHNVIGGEEPLVIQITNEKGLLAVRNDYRPRLSEVMHTGKGIENLKKRYSLLTQEKCFFSIDKSQYIALIPLLDLNSYVK